MTSRFGIIIPCYKYGHFLRECVESVRSQTVRDLSVLIVDDASPDDTPRIAAELAAEDPRVRVLTHEVNKGHIASYNEALGIVHAEYTLVLSADDLLTAGSLERAGSALDSNPSAALCFGDDIPFRTGELRPAARCTGHAGATYFTYAEFLQQACNAGLTPIQAPTAIMRAAVQQRSGGFLPELPHSGDTEIWLRLAAQGGVVKVHADQAFRRLHATNMSLEYSDVWRLREQERAFKTHFKTMGDRLPMRSDLETRLRRALASASFWTAARAFDSGKTSTLQDALRYALATDPSIARQGPYRRLQVKRILGARIWRAIQALIDRRANQMIRSTASA